MARPALPMPLPVQVAAAAFGAMFVFGSLGMARFDLTRDLLFVPALAVGGLGLVILVGMLRARSLAWQAARLMGSIATLGGAAAVVVSGAFHPDLVPGAALFLGCGALVVAGLVRPDAMRYFDLRCVDCRTNDVRPVGLWFDAVECRTCGRRWKPHEVRVDPSVFD